jgi:hypothetical protein
MNTYREDGDITYLTITSRVHGRHEFLIDTDDLPRVRAVNWVISNYRGRIYAHHSFKYSGSILLHRLVTSFEYDLVDHVNNDSKDNRKCNLRAGTHAQNMRNSKIQKNNKLGVKGVRWREERKKFEASIWHGKSIFLGLFNTREEAALAYNEAAKRLFGEFARLNEVVA